MSTRTRSRRGKRAQRVPQRPRKPRKAATKAGPLREFNPREVIFIDARVQGLNATRAAELAGFASPRMAGSRMMTDDDIAGEIQRRQADRSERLDIQVDDLILEHILVARADPNEVVQIRRNCCRYCWGKRFAYQMTQRELDERKAQYDRQVEASDKEFKKRKDAKAHDQAPVIPAFDELGGVGFDKRKDPNSKCPECFGDGVEEVVIADSRKLSRAGRALFRGVKRTRDGVEVKLADQHGARIEAGKLLGHYAGKGETGPSLEDLIAGAFSAGAKAKAGKGATA